ncbi:hypothetical protein ACE38V_11850 [Cytobacillus sp. Hz8]|uniref:hypothetical protein n=1 Tax=Cytobacillus sp. Hz8 TaxID=3347168 RepID=UPI0035DF6967
MTKISNKGSKNQNSPKAENRQTEFSQEISGDNSKGNKRNKDQKAKTDTNQ